MFKNLCASGGGLPLCPENLQLYTMILQRPRIIVGRAGFEPKTSGPEVWCVTTTLRWQISEITWEERVPGQCHALDTVVVGRHQVHLGGDYPAPAITHLKHLKKKKNHHKSLSVAESESIFWSVGSDSWRRPKKNIDRKRISKIRIFQFCNFFASCLLYVVSHFCYSVKNKKFQKNKKNSTGVLCKL